MTKLTKNFLLEEFDCRDGSKVPEKYLDNVKELAKNLQVLRDYIKEAVFVNSGYRTPSWNRKVKGEKSSKHLIAQAADIVTKNYSSSQLGVIIEKLIREKKMVQGGLAVYKGFVHYDTRGVKARWYPIKSKINEAEDAEW